MVAVQPFGAGSAARPCSPIANARLNVVLPVWFAWSVNMSISFRTCPGLSLRYAMFAAEIAIMKLQCL